MGMTYKVVQQGKEWLVIYTSSISGKPFVVAKFYASYLAQECKDKLNRRERNMGRNFNWVEK